MIKGAGSKFDDYSISHKIRQMLLHWGYELTKKDFLINSVLDNNLHTIQFDFCQKSKYFVSSVSNNNLHN